MDNPPATELTEKGARDWSLVQRALKDDQKAYEALVKHYRDIIFFMLLKMVRNKDDASDLTIVAFTKAFKKLHQYSPEFTFSTWLFRIASNNCIDFIRRKKQTISLDRNYVSNEGDEYSFDPRSDTLNPEERIIRKQKMQLMQCAVEKLEPHYRELVHLHYYQEKSYEEIAVKLNLPIGTVKGKLFRARDLMQRSLKNIYGKI